jgi:hypothetical protein
MKTVSAVVCLSLLASMSFAAPKKLPDHVLDQVTAGMMQFSLGFADGGILNAIIDGGRLQINGNTTIPQSVTVTIDGVTHKLVGPTFDFNTAVPNSLNSLVITSGGPVTLDQNSPPAAILTLEGVGQNSQVVVTGNGASNNSAVVVSSGQTTRTNQSINGMNIIQGSTLSGVTIGRAAP